MNRIGKPCEEKIRYTSFEEVTRVVLRIRLDNRNGHFPARPYKCQGCWGWHVTGHRSYMDNVLDKAIRRTVTDLFHGRPGYGDTSAFFPKRVVA